MISLNLLIEKNVKEYWKPLAWNRLSRGSGSWSFVFVDFKSHRLLLGGFSVSHPQLWEWLLLVA